MRIGEFTIFVWIVCFAVSSVASQATNCSSEPCQNGALCRNTESGYQCFCVDGYAGDNCEINFDDCGSIPCRNNATCIDGVATYHCDCFPGFTGDDCEIDIDECLSNPCLRNGTCINLVDGFTCECLRPYRGDNCSLLPCQTLPCENEAVCRDDVTFNESLSGYMCDCLQGFTGPRCESNIDDCPGANITACNSNGLCIDGINDYSCLCGPGWVGKYCELPIDDCIGAECRNNATCVDRHLGYTCVCLPGYEGSLCEREKDECRQWSPCQNGATCLDMFDNYTCECAAGWTGINCTQEVDECATSPCHGGATCQDVLAGYVCLCLPFFTGRLCDVSFNPCSPEYNPCQNGARCVVPPNGQYRCFCASGFTGVHCEVNINECTDSPCANNGTCEDIVAGYRCHCGRGWTGQNCDANIDECGSTPCQHDAQCFDLIDGFECNCTREYSGRFCDAVVNFCLNDPCYHDGTCISVVGGYQCQCLPPYTGEQCLNLIDACKSDPCQNNASCSNTVDGFSCTCPLPFTGRTCSEVINYCASDPCLNGGTCLSVEGGFTCNCPPYLTGKQCTDLIDYCKDEPCKNEGLCINDLSKFRCVCKYGYLGPTCQELVDFCVKAPCQNSGVCTNFPGGFSCSCASSFAGDLCQSLVPSVVTPSSSFMSSTASVITSSMISSTSSLYSVNLHGTYLMSFSTSIGTSSFSSFYYSSILLSPDTPSSIPLTYISLTSLISVSFKTNVMSKETLSSMLSSQYSFLLSSTIQTLPETETVIPSISPSKALLSLTVSSKVSSEKLESFATSIAPSSVASFFSSSFIPTSDLFVYSKTIVADSVFTTMPSINFDLSYTIPPYDSFSFATSQTATKSMSEFSLSLFSSSYLFTSELLTLDAPSSVSQFISLSVTFPDTIHYTKTKFSSIASLAPSPTGRYYSDTFVISSLSHTISNTFESLISSESFIVSSPESYVSTSNLKTTSMPSSFSSSRFSSSNGTVISPSLSNLPSPDISLSRSRDSIISTTLSHLSVSSSSIPILPSASRTIEFPSIITSASVETGSYKSDMLPSFTLVMSASDPFVTTSLSTTFPSKSNELSASYSGRSSSLSPSFIDSTSEDTGNTMSSFSFHTAIDTVLNSFSTVTSALSFSMFSTLTVLASSTLTKRVSVSYSTSLNKSSTIFTKVSSSVHFSTPSWFSASYSHKSISVSTMDTPNLVSTLFPSYKSDNMQTFYSSPLTQLSHSVSTTLFLAISPTILPTPVSHDLSTYETTMWTYNPFGTSVSGSTKKTMSFTIASHFESSLSESSKQKIASYSIPVTTASRPFHVSSINTVDVSTLSEISDKYTTSVLKETSITTVSTNATQIDKSSLGETNSVSVSTTATFPLQSFSSSDMTSSFENTVIFSSNTSILDDRHVTPVSTTIHLTHVSSFRETDVFSNSIISTSPSNNISSSMISSVSEIAQQSLSSSMHGASTSSAIDVSIFSIFPSASSTVSVALSSSTFGSSNQHSISEVPSKGYSSISPSFIPVSQVVPESLHSRSSSSSLYSSISSSFNLYSSVSSSFGLSLSISSSFNLYSSVSSSSNLSSSISSSSSQYISIASNYNSVSSGPVHSSMATSMTETMITTTKATSMFDMMTSTPITSTTVVSSTPITSSAVVSTTEAPPSSCDTFACLNAGTCREDWSGVYCDCEQSFVGLNCEIAASACQGFSCENGGVCSVTLTTHNEQVPKCDCPINYTGTRCDIELLVYYPSFLGTSFLQYTTPIVEYNQSNEIYISVKTTLSDGTILFSANQNVHYNDASFIRLYLIGGKLVYSYSCDGRMKGTIDTDTLINTGDTYNIIIRQVWARGPGQWCSAAMLINGRPYFNSPVLTVGESQVLDNIYIGGMPRYSYTNGDISITHIVNGFIGCVHGFQINQREFDLVSVATDGRNVENCNVPVCQHNPCKNGATCHSSGDEWYCACPQQYGGKFCERKLCHNNPCQHGGTCIILEAERDQLCICPYGRGGVACEKELAVTAAQFSGTVKSYSSYLTYAHPHYLEDRMEIQFNMVLETNSTTSNLVLYMGPTGSESNNGQDFLAVGLHRGYVVFKYDLGSGLAEIYSTQPVNLSLPHHTISLCRDGTDGWLSLDDQGIVRGRSQGPLNALNTPSPLYVGGVDEVDGRSSRAEFDDGLIGCVYNLKVRNLQTEFVVPGRPAGHVEEGRNVAQCSTMECDNNPCQNGAECVNLGASLFCNCTDGWKGTFCMDQTTVCDLDHSCAEGSTCVPIVPKGYQCLCPLGRQGEICTKVVTISDALFIGEKSFMAFTPVYVKRHLHVRLQIKPSRLHGLLFYVAQHLHSNAGDFLSVSLNSGKVELRYNLGSEVNVVRSDITLAASKDTWYAVEAGRNLTRGYLSVDGHMTAAMTTGKMSYLDTTTLFYLGGVPRLDDVSPQAFDNEPSAFEGCIREMVVNGNNYELTEKGAVAGQNIADCDNTSCGFSTCKNGGQCIPTSNSTFNCTCTSDYTGLTCTDHVQCQGHRCEHGQCVVSGTAGYTCSCFLGWSGQFCDTRTILGQSIRVTGTSYVYYKDGGYESSNTSVTNMRLDFRTTDLNGVILWNGQTYTEEEDYLGVGIQDGRLKVVWNLGWYSRSEVVTAQRYNDGTWHTVTISRNNQALTLTVDGTSYDSRVSGDFNNLDTLGQFYIGGFSGGLVREMTLTYFSAMFTGCIRNLHIEGTTALTFDDAKDGRNVLICDPG